MTTQSTDSILWVVGDKISQERLQVFTRTLNYLKQKFSITMIKAAETPEAEIIKTAKSGGFQLIMVPWDKYLEWTRLDAQLGANRIQGPVMAGYFWEPLAWDLVPAESGPSQRRILVDIYHLPPSEVYWILKTMLYDKLRSGIQPLLHPTTLIHCENWYSRQGLGDRMDHILQMPAVSQFEWKRRNGSIRILISSLWAHVFDEGPGKNQTVDTSSPQSHSPLAYFQFAADSGCLVFRLCYNPSSHHLSPSEMVQLYTPSHQNPGRPAQLLVRYADFLRVHLIPEAGMVEIVAALLPSAPSEKSAEHFHSLWVEPITKLLVIEPPYDAPGPNSPRLRGLPSVSAPQVQLKAVEPLVPRPGEKMAKRLIHEATLEIRNLKSTIKSQNDKIRELRSGGIGSAPPLSPPEAEDLLAAFQERYFDARFQIRQFALQIEKMSKQGAKPFEIETVRLKMEALENREKAWIRKLMSTLEDYRKTIKNNKGK